MTRALVSMCGACVILLLHAGGAGAGSATFTDPAGDGRGGVDITSVSIAETDQSALQFGIVGTGFDKNTEVDIYLDTDHNARTGQAGSDYILRFYVAPDVGWNYESYRWEDDGWTYYDWSGAALLAASGTIAATVPRADIGGASSFSFFAVAVKYDSTNTVVARDDAPDDTAWTFDASPLTSAELVRPVISAPLPAPARIRSGQPVMLRYAVTRSDNGGIFAGHIRDAYAFVGNQEMPVTTTLVRGIATVRVTPPRGSRGRKLYVYLTIASPYEAAHRYDAFVVHS